MNIVFCNNDYHDIEDSLEKIDKFRKYYIDYLNNSDRKLSIASIDITITTAIIFSGTYFLFLLDHKYNFIAFIAVFLCMMFMFIGTFGAFLEWDFYRFGIINSIYRKKKCSQIDDLYNKIYNLEREVEKLKDIKADIKCVNTLESFINLYGKYGYKLDIDCGQKGIEISFNAKKIKDNNVSLSPVSYRFAIYEKYKTLLFKEDCIDFSFLDGELQNKCKDIEDETMQFISLAEGVIPLDAETRLLIESKPEGNNRQVSYNEGDIV